MNDTIDELIRKWTDRATDLQEKALACSKSRNFMPATELTREFTTILEFLNDLAKAKT